MILYGRNLSPFTRRVAIWCRLQGRQVERRELPTFGESFEEIRRQNPVGRVPVLVLDDGTKLIEAFAICDWLEETAPEGLRLLPQEGKLRRDCLQTMALGHGITEKAVAMVYERNRRPDELHWREWQQRVAGQIRDGLAALDGQVPQEGFYGGDGPNGADIVAVCAWDFLVATNRWLLEAGYPKLQGLAERADRLDAFAETKPVDG